MHYSKISWKKNDEVCELRYRPLKMDCKEQYNQFKGHVFEGINVFRKSFAKLWKCYEKVAVPQL